MVSFLPVIVTAAFPDDVVPMIVTGWSAEIFTLLAQSFELACHLDDKSTVLIVGAKTILVLSNRIFKYKYPVVPDYICNNLNDAVNWIIKK